MTKVKCNYSVCEEPSRFDRNPNKTYICYNLGLNGLCSLEEITIEPCEGVYAECDNLVYGQLFLMEVDGKMIRVDKRCLDEKESSK